MRQGGQGGSDLGELGEGGLEIFDDLGGDDVRRRQVGGVLERFVTEPKHIEAGLIASDEFVVGEPVEALALDAFGTYRLARGRRP
jgi:hypothetical protein